MQVTESIDVQYKFLSKYGRYQDPDVHAGKLEDIDRERAIVAGFLPDEGWIDALTEGKVLLGINIFLPAQSVPIKVLAGVEKVLPNPKGVRGKTDTHFVLGFRDISPDHHRRIIRFLVSLYIKKPAT